MSKQAQRWTRKPYTRATIRNAISQREFVADARRLRCAPECDPMSSAESAGRLRDARQFGRDSGDTYGRHALVNPGGENRQIDVWNITALRDQKSLDSAVVNPDYVGAHRVQWYYYGSNARDYGPMVEMSPDGLRIGRNRTLANDR